MSKDSEWHQIVETIPMSIRRTYEVKDLDQAGRTRLRFQKYLGNSKTSY